MPRTTTIVPAAFASGIGAVCWLWWRDVELTSAAANTTELGRLCGLLAAYFLAVQLVLRARIPVIENRVDTARLARWHRRCGTALVSCAAVHAVLVTWGYAGLANQSVLGEVRVLVISYPDVLMATVALGLLISVAVLATRAIRRRLPYETWYHLHLYVYLAVAFVLAHQIANGKHFASDAAARAVWLGLYAAVALLLLWYRVLTPLRRLVRHRLRVVAVSAEPGEATSVLIGGRDLNRLHVWPGQFLRWRFLTPDRWWSANPYSVSSVPSGDQLRITVKAAGDHSRNVRTLRPGTRVLAEGPYGALTTARAAGSGVLLIAGGVGITPLRALFESAPPGPMTLLYRAHSAADVLFRDEIDELAAARGADVHYVLGDRDEIGDALTARGLRRLVPDVASRDVYVCGPAGLTASLERTLRSLGVPAARLHTEAFTLHTR